MKTLLCFTALSPVRRMVLVCCLVIVAQLWLMTAPALAVLPDVRRLSPKNALAGEKAGAVATGFGRVVLGSPAAVNPRTGVATGAVYVFDARTGRELATVYPPVADANAGMEFGHAVAVSGSLLLVGAPGADSTPAAADDVGAGFVFDLRTGRQAGGKLQSAFFLPGERMGEVVAMDGNRAVLASPGGKGFAENAAVETGVVYVFDLTSGEETVVSPDSANLPGATTGAAGDGFGTALALRGNLLTVGAPGADVGGDADAGRVFAVSLNPGGEAALLLELDNPHVADLGQDGTGDAFGAALALSNRHLVVGAPEDESGRGVVHVFDASRPHELAYWNVIAGVNPGDRAGRAVAAEGNRVFLASGEESVFGYLLQAPYERSESFGTLEAETGMFGAQLAAADDMLAVAAPGWDGPAGGDTGAALVFRTTSLACPDFFPLAVTRNLAHGTSADEYLDFPEVVAHLGGGALDYGTPFYLGRMAGALAAQGNGTGVWAYDAITATVPFLGMSGAVARTLSRPISNLTGGWWWRSQVLGPQTVNFFRSDGNGAQAELHGGNGILFGVNRPLKAADELRVDDAVADAAVVTLRLRLGGDVGKDNDSGILSLADNPANHAFATREGDASGVPNVSIGEVAPRAAQNAGVTSFTCGLVGTGTSPQTNQAVFCNGAMVARRGGNAPSAKTSAGAPAAAVFSSFTGVTHGASQACLFRATLNAAPGVTAANNEGIWSDRSGALDLVLQKGLPAPLLGGVVRIKRLLDFALLGDDAVMILVQLSGPGVRASNDLVLYLSHADVTEPGAFEILAREGDRLPALNGARLGGILRLETAATVTPFTRNHYGLLCSLVNEPGRVTAASNQVWLVGDAAPGALNQPAARRALPKLRKGASSHFFGTGFEVLTSISFPAVTRDVSGARGTGMAHVIDPRSGGSTGVASFPNRRKAAGLILR